MRDPTRAIRAVADIHSLLATERNRNEQSLPATLRPCRRWLGLCRMTSPVNDGYNGNIILESMLAWLKDGRAGDREV